MYEFRLARPGDKAQLVSFTHDTFAWGDYIERRFDAWLDDDRARTLVAQHDGMAVALARGNLLSQSELWIQGGRVHPDHRGSGLFFQLISELLEWGTKEGAEVVRAYVEEDTPAPHRTMTKHGFRSVSDWLFAQRDIVNGDPQPTGNGGKRVPGPERFRIASSSEAGPAFMSWSTSEAGRLARGLFPETWEWRKLTIAHLEEAARDDRLLEASSGWAIAQSRDLSLEVSWLSARESDMYRMVRACLDRAIEVGCDHLAVWFPATEPARAALERIGCSFESGSVWERGLLT